MNQKELKALYRAEMLKAWDSNVKMADYCTNKTSVFVELSGGRILAIEKPNIQTDFCFGYGYMGNDDYQDAVEREEYASTHEDYFLKENLKGIESRIAELKRVSGVSYDKTYILPAYYGGMENKAVCYDILTPERAEYTARNCEVELCNADDLEKIIAGYEDALCKFEKRLHTYLKRYGLSKLHTWVYWQD